MSTLRLRTSPLIPRNLKSAGLLLTYATMIGVVLLLLAANVEGAPLQLPSRSISITPSMPQAEPNSATAHLLMSLNALAPMVVSFGYVTHPYLMGRGALLGFAGDNIQVFEYPTSEVARSEAAAIFEKAPRTAAKSYFHLFLRENLIVLYFGHNETVLKITEAMVGSPLTSSGGGAPQ